MMRLFFACILLITIDTFASTITHCEYLEASEKIICGNGKVFSLENPAPLKIESTFSEKKIELKKKVPASSWDFTYNFETKKN